MACTKILVLLAFAVTAAHCQIITLQNLQAVEPCKTDVNYPICQDTTTVQLCFNNVLYNGTCKLPRPYCNLGKCTDEPPAFKCPTDPAGYYPDPLRCDVFYLCDGTTSKKFDCSAIDTSSVYDPVLKACVRQSPERPCHRFNCFNKTLSVYSGDSTIYTFCQGNVPQGLSKCPDFQVFQESAYSCDSSCTREGRIPDSERPNGFFDCVSKGDGTFVKVAGDCGIPNYVFDSQELVCKKSA